MMARWIAVCIILIFLVIHVRMEDISVEVDPGYLNKRVVLFIEPVAFNEAFSLCKKYGKPFKKTSRIIFAFLKNALERQNRSELLDNIWILVYRNAGSSQWISPTCGNVTVPGQSIFNEDISLTQCLYINMTQNPNLTNAYHGIYYATSCDDKKPFLCFIPDKSLRDAFDIYENAIVWNEFVYTTYNNVTLTECVGSFKKSPYRVVGAEFDLNSTSDLTGQCILYNITAQQIPHIVRIQTGHDNITALLKRKRDVLIDDREHVGNFTVPMPSCLKDTTTVATSHPVDITTTQPTCHCVCDNITTKTMGELDKRIEEIKKILVINKTSLSSFRREKSSASDERVSSATIGYFGIIFLVGVASMILIGDMQYAITELISKIKR